MSEKFYALLLRLYPSHFCEEYRDEALQLFRDRVRDERGFLPRLRLWVDVLLDLVISVPREYLHVSRPAAVVSTPQRLWGVPFLYVLQEQPLRPSALLFGGVLSVAAVATMWSSLTLSRGYPDAARSGFGADSSSGLPQTEPRVPGATLASAPSAMERPAGRFSLIDDVERKRVIAGARANLTEHYIDRESGQKMADALLEHQKRGDYDVAKDGFTFAFLVTQTMREVSPDRHLTLEYSVPPLPERQGGMTAEGFALYRNVMKQQNCTFEKVEMLPRNIGYLKIDSFPDVSVCQETASAAMKSLNSADAIIFDLRDNRGGQPAMVAMLAAYLFDHPEYWYNPRENTTEASWTRSPVPGNELADKPVYVLTSAKTFSGAEQFCYDLKMLKRATLVGETTGGAAHAGVWHRIDEHFGIGIPETRAINPFGKEDWAEVGVEPDVKVKAADALATAERLARERRWR